MIEALKSEELLDKAGGRFKLTVLLQHRVRELLDGARPMVEPAKMTPLEIAVQETLQGKLRIDFAASGLAEPDAPIQR